MPTYKANKASGEHHDIPDNEQIVSQKTVGGVEIITTEEQNDEYVCDTCGATFDTEAAHNGHQAAH